MAIEPPPAQPTRHLPLVDERNRAYEHPLYRPLLEAPGLSVAVASLDQLLTWGLANSLWIFPMATSCCGIELMAAAASRVDLDRMGSIVRASPRQSDVMVVAGTITVKMAPRVKKLWEQMPEPKWCIAMGSCAISGDFYRNLYSVIPGIDTVVPVDVYIPGCPPNPEGLMHGLIRLQEKIRLQRQGRFVSREENPALLAATLPSVSRFTDPARDPRVGEAQAEVALSVTELDVSAVHRLEMVVDAASPPPPDTTVLCGPLDGNGYDDDEVEEEEPEVKGVDHGGTAPDLAALLASDFGIAELPKDGPPVVPAARHLELARRLRDAGYRQFVHVVASHWPAGRGRAGAAPDEVEHYELAYALRTLGAGSRLATWSLKLAVGESAPSLVGLFAGADWQEREQYDLLGVEFAGHPDLRRIMLPEGWDGHPLRREYPADAHVPPWR